MAEQLTQPSHSGVYLPVPDTDHMKWFPYKDYPNLQPDPYFKLEVDAPHHGIVTAIRKSGHQDQIMVARLDEAEATHAAFCELAQLGETAALTRALFDLGLQADRVAAIMDNSSF